MLFPLPKDAWHSGWNQEDWENYSLAWFGAVRFWGRIAIRRNSGISDRSFSSPMTSKKVIKKGRKKKTGIPLKFKVIWFVLAVAALYLLSCIYGR
jgi:hypothetical protein